MKLYDCKTAPSPRRVRIFAAEKGIELQTVAIDLASGEQFKSEFRQINPDCVVPVLELDDGTRITEVIAICQYLEEQRPEPTLFGRTALERAVTLMWNAKVEQQGFMAVADAFRNTAKGLKNHAVPGIDQHAQIPELAERGRKRVEIFLDKLNQQLGDRKFLTGEFFTFADISAFVVVDFAARLKMNIPDNAADLQRWHDEVSSRPSASA